MAYQFVLPDIGEGVVEGEIVKWHVAVGDTVKEDQTLVEIMTDKATVQIPSPKSGKIVKLAGKEGDIARVGHMLLEIDTGAVTTANAPAINTSAVAAPAMGAAPQAASVLTQSNELPSSGSPLLGSHGQFELLATPAVRKLAREEGISLAHIKGTGPNGRITREDVMNAAAGPKTVAPVLAHKVGQTPIQPKPISTAQLSVSKPTTPAPAVNNSQQAQQKQQQVHASVPAVHKPQPPAQTQIPAVQTQRTQPQTLVPHQSVSSPVPSGFKETRVPLRGLRKRIAERMHVSKTTAAHFTYVEEIDFTELVKFRDRMKAQAQKQSVKLSYLPFVMKACIVALKKFPDINALMDDARNELVLRQDYHIGFAVQTPDGLMVPVIRDANTKSIFQIATEVEQLAEKCRQKTASTQELTGSSFTITSLGLLGGVLATPVINYPEVAILGIHAIRERPMVVDGQIAVRQMANFAASFDHRLIDGYVGAEFIAEVKKHLENPELLFMAMA